MTLNEYQEKAMTTCMPSSENFSYMFLNLVGEVGELASKVAKGIRKDMFYIGCNGSRCNDLHDSSSINRPADSMRDEMKKEAGDILWQLSGLCEVMGWTLEEVAQMNIDKLASRQNRGVIDGDGDNR